MQQQLGNEKVPYGINMVNAFNVPDDNVSNRKVCIIDTGYDLKHPDLPNESTGAKITGSAASGLVWSEDGSKYLLSALGSLNALCIFSNKFERSSTDGHGTHVAGTIAAVGNNGRGVVGVNRNGKLSIHVVRIFDNNGIYVWASSLVKAAEDCANNNANVVNMSLGGGGFSTFEANAYKRIFEEEDILIVAAAGNGGNTQYSYPASYDAVMSVAAVDRNEKLAGFSQRNNQVEISAPGVDIFSTTPGGTYSQFDGTSMATPHVAGVAALVWSNFPEKSAVEIRAALQITAKDLGSPGRDNSFGFGLIQADQAYLLLGGMITAPPTASPTVELPCSDSPPGWYDQDGETYNCKWYSRFGRCDVYGEMFINFGLTAKQACCDCGGGERILNSDTDLTSSSPSASPVDALSDNPSIKVSSSPSATPTAIKSDRPSERPSSSPSVTPTGSPTIPVSSTSPTTAPTKSPTNPTLSSGPSIGPISAPSVTLSLSPTESVCADTGGWYDSGGALYNCNWYENSNNCSRYGEYFQNYGQTAKDACCVCGGGLLNRECTDTSDWNDSGGAQYTCAWYAAGNGRCSVYGSLFKNKGLTANTACCVCKNR